MSTELPPRNRSGPPPLPSKASQERTIPFDESPIHSLVNGIRKCVKIGGLGKIAAWLGLAAVIVIAVDIMIGLPSAIRALAEATILVGAVFLAISYFILKPRRFTAADATRKIESEHPEFGQILRTARDASADKTSISPVLKNELFRRASIHLAGLDVKKHYPKSAANKWLLGGIAAIACFCAMLIFHREAPTAFARLVAPFSSVTFTRVVNSTPDPTFDKNRLPHIEAILRGRAASDVRVLISNEDGTETTYPMNRIGGGRYEATLPTSDKSFDFRIVGGDSSPVAGSMECVDPAEFVSSSSEITFPDYTGRAPVTQDTADITTVEGTQATLHFKMSAPMGNATLKLPGGTRVPLQVNGDEVFTSFEVAIGGDSAELTGTDARGHDIAPIQFKHKGIADKLPSVEWVEPTKDIDVTSITEIPLRLRIQDDFGVATYGVVLEARGENKELLTKSIEAKDLKDLSEMTSAALESFPLTIRDNVRLYAWATDHKPRDNARSVSKLRGVDIRPFKRKWQMITGPSGPPPIAAEDIKKVEDLIKAQRVVLSDAFTVIQNTPPKEEEFKKLAIDESKVQQDSMVLHAKAVEEGEWPADDISLLAAAATQMGEAASAWEVVQAKPGFQQADAALSTLLELRKNLLTILMKADCPCEEPKPEEVPDEIVDLAKEAERLAHEERDVAKQLQETKETERLTAIRRQQDVANSDTGELHARLMNHPEATPESLSLMADAEKDANFATRATRSPEAGTSAPPVLDRAAESLEAVAKHLRSLDEANMDETLAKMAEEAKKAAETVKPGEEEKKPEEKKPEDKLAKEDGEKPGEKPGDKPGEGEKPGPAPGEKPGNKPGEGKSPGEGEGKSPSEMAGDKPGQSKGPGQGEGPGEPSEQASNGQGEGPGDKPGQGEGEAKEPGQGNGKPDEEFAKNDPDAGNSKGPGEKAGASPGKGPGATPGQGQPGNAEEERKEALAKAARQSALNDDILKFFAEREAKDGKESRFDDLRKETNSESLEKKLNEVAEGKNDGAKTAEELLALSAALEREREIRRQSLLENLAKTHEKAVELKKQAEAKRAEDRKAAKELADAKNGGFSFELPKKLKEEALAAKTGAGKPGEPKPGAGNKEGEGGGQGAEELAREVSRFNDTELTRVAASLRSMAPDLSDIRPIAEAERRLAQMMEEISGLARSDDSEGAVPPAFRRAVEDYYRALSDDFGDEEQIPR